MRTIGDLTRFGLGFSSAIAAVTLTLTIFPGAAAAQPGRNRPPAIRSPEVDGDRNVTLRVRAPEAKAVGLSSSDLPGGSSRGR